MQLPWVTPGGMWCKAASLCPMNSLQNMAVAIPLTPGFPSPGIFRVSSSVTESCKPVK